jgi:hypothetical protein
VPERQSPLNTGHGGLIRGCYRNPVNSEPPVDQPHRRIAVIPVTVAVIAVLALAVIVIVVITLDAATGPTVSPQQSTPSATSPANEQDSVSPQPPVVAPTGESTGTLCIDYTADANALDIDEVSVSQSDRNEVTVEFKLTAAVPDGVAKLGIYVEPADNQRAYQFSVEITDGEVTGLSSYEFEREKSTRIDPDNADLDGAVSRFVVPGSLAKKSDDDWSWFAFTTLDEVARDSCPGDPGSFETLRFTRDD